MTELHGGIMERKPTVVWTRDSLVVEFGVRVAGSSDEPTQQLTVPAGTRIEFVFKISNANGIYLRFAQDDQFRDLEVLYTTKPGEVLPDTLEWVMEEAGTYRLHSGLVWQAENWCVDELARDVHIQLLDAPQPQDDVPDPNCPGGDRLVLDTGNTVNLQVSSEDSTQDDENLTVCIQGLLKPPQFILDMPVRDLTRADALNIVVWLIQQGDVVLDAQKLKFDANCQLSFPTPGSKLNIKPLVGGVTWTNIATSQTHVLGGLDPRGVVLIWKTSIFLRDEFGVSTIHHPGFTGGGGMCHREGRAIDFSGCVGTFPDPFPRDPALAGRLFALNVQRDWGNRPVPAGSNPPTAAYRLAADRALAFTPGSPPSPIEVRRAAAVLFGSFYEEFVALNSSDQDQKRQAYDSATGLPTGVYDPATGSTVPGTDPNLPASRVGQAQRFAIGPDYGRDAGLRVGHQNHIHYQVSTTDSEPHPP